MARAPPVIIVVNRPPGNREYAELQVMEFLEQRHAHIKGSMMTLIRLWACVHDNSLGRLQAIRDHNMLPAPL